MRHMRFDLRCEIFLGVELEMRVPAARGQLSAVRKVYTADWMLTMARPGIGATPERKERIQMKQAQFQALDVDRGVAGAVSDGAMQER